MTGQTLTTLNQRRQETALNRPCRVPPGSAVLAKTLGLGLAQLPHGPWLVCALRNTPSPALPPKIQGLAPHTPPGPCHPQRGEQVLHSAHLSSCPVRLTIHPAFNEVGVEFPRNFAFNS